MQWIIIKNVAWSLHVCGWLEDELLSSAPPIWQVPRCQQIQGIDSTLLYYLLHKYNLSPPTITFRKQYSQLKSLREYNRKKKNQWENCREMDAVQIVKSSPSPSHEGIRIVRGAIRLFAVFVVFLGTLFIWFMMPTNTFKQTWRPQIRRKANSSTSLGSAGSNNWLILIKFFWMM